MAAAAAARLSSKACFSPSGRRLFSMVLRLPVLEACFSPSVRHLSSMALRVPVPGACSSPSGRHLPVSKTCSSPSGRRLSSVALRLSVPTGTRAAKVGACYYRFHQQRPVFTEEEKVAFARVRELTGELTKNVAIFPSSAIMTKDALHTEVMKMRWELKYYKFFGGMVLTLNGVLPNHLVALDKDSQDMKTKLGEAQKQVVDVKAKLGEAQKEVVDVKANLAEAQKQILELKNEIAEGKV